MKEKFNFDKFNSRLATLVIIFAGLGIAAIILMNMQWLATNHYGFYEFSSIFAGLALFVLPFLFVGWVFSWIVGRRKKDVDHVRMPIGKGVAAIVLFWAFFLALNFQMGQTEAVTVLNVDDLTMYNHSGNYYIEFTGSGEIADDEIISLRVSKDQFEEISSYKDTVLIEYKYFDKLPPTYHFVLAKSKETDSI